MKILAIETSCDETSAAVVENGTKILSNIIASSAVMHAKTGGVIPESAAREQIKSIIPVVNECLEAAFPGKSLDEKVKEIDAIAVTVGPGLVGSLLVGVETAKTLSILWGKPLVPVNHLVAHLYANWFEKIPEFPALGLVVSGGHTDLVLIENHNKLTWLGGTRDDAAGEAFDKTARLLGLPYPGGPNLSKEAQIYLDKSEGGLTFFPRPLSSEDNLEWSFSGLKTAVLREIEKTQKENLDVPKIAAEVQEAIVDSIVGKSAKAVAMFKPQSFLLAGGVAANMRLREKFKSELSSKAQKTAFHVPEPRLCTDNASYIASCAYFTGDLNTKFSPGLTEKIGANPELTISDKV